MSDWLPDSPYMATAYCPNCLSSKDPTKEILETRWCETHAPRMEGESDGEVTSQGYLSGSAEAGGDENRRVCELLAPEWDVISEKDLAWLSGILEGEGSFTVTKSNKQYPKNIYPVISMSTTDHDVMERVAKLLGAAIYHYDSKRYNGKKMVWRIMFTGWKAAKWMEKLLPHMGLRRSIAIRVSLDVYNHRKDGA